MLRFIPVIFAFVLIQAQIFAHAKGELSIQAKYYKPLEEIETAFSVPSCAEDYKVKVGSNLGHAEIFNPARSKWIQNGLSWEDYPKLASKMKIRVFGVTESGVNLEFQTQNTESGDISKSEPVTIWLSGAYDDYIETLNKNIMSW